MAKQKYDVLTWDSELQKWTPQAGVRRGPYTLFGLRKAIRKLRYLGYTAHRSVSVRTRDGEVFDHDSDPFVYIYARGE